jgi:hypothetical protein
MSAAYFAIVVVAAVLALYIAVRALFPGGGEAAAAHETMLLEEAVVIEPVAPGMVGKAEIRKPGAQPLRFKVRATDASQAYARGTKVRVIDLREEVCIIESADEVHLVR